MCFYELDGLNKHTTRTATRVIKYSIVRLKHFGNQVYNTLWCVELSFTFSFCKSELTKEILIYTTYNVVLFIISVDTIDFIMANPPFNQKQWRAENELVDDPRWNGYEVPPTSNANYGWILNIVSKLSQNGVAGFLLANGALSDDGTELKIRQQLIENHLVEAIIILPRNLFYTTDISVTLWVLNKNKKARVVEQNGKLKRYRNREDEILFMDLRQMGSPYEKKYIELTEEDRAKVTSVYHNWQQEGYEETYENVPEFCYSASFDEVKEKGFTLVPSRYIEFVNRDENIDFDTKMKSLQGELKELLAQEEKSKSDLLAVFKELGYEIEL